MKINRINCRDVQRIREIKKIVQRRSSKMREECITSKANLAPVPACEDVSAINSGARLPGLEFWCRPCRPSDQDHVMKSLCLFPHFTNKNNDSFHTGKRYGLNKLFFVVYLKLCLVSEKCYASIFKFNIIKGVICLTKCHFFPKC